MAISSFKNILKNIFKNIYLFFIVLFTIFIAATFLKFVINKPIRYFFPHDHKTTYWIIYVCLIVLASLLISAAAVLFEYKSKTKRTIFYIPFITAVCAIPRIIWISIVNVVPKGDFELYDILATAFSQGNVIGQKYISVFPHVVGYPLFLSRFYRLFGANVLVGQILNVILGCGIAILLFYVGRRILNEKCGFIAAILWSLWPSQIMYASLLSSEALFTLLFMAAIYLFINIIKGNFKSKYFNEYVLFFILGLILAVINAIRPLGILFIIAAGIYILFMWNYKKPFRNIIIKKVLLCVVLVVTYTLLTNFTNVLISRSIGLQAAKSPLGFNAYIGSNYFHYGSWNIEDSKRLEDMMWDPELSAQDIHDILLKDALQRYKSMSKRGIVELADKKHETMWVTDNDIIKYILDAHDGNTSKLNYMKYARLLIKYTNLYYHAILLICFFTGIFMIKRRDSSHINFVFILIAGFIAVHMIMEVAGRYHYPVIPLFALIAAYGLTTFNMRAKLNINGHMPFLKKAQ